MGLIAHIPILGLAYQDQMLYQRVFVGVSPDPAVGLNAPDTLRHKSQRGQAQDNLSLRHVHRKEDRNRHHAM